MPEIYIGAGEEATVLPEPVVMDEVDQLLLDAEWCIREHGWCRRAYVGRVDGKVCVMGAIFHASGASPRVALCRPPADGLWARAEKRLCSALGVPCIETWNDTVCESEEQAIKALRKARRA